ncbi:MAG: LysR family transcriptional regulator [Crocinitomicaceae bacterium]|nr:LysR family transcriptional regulator [Crocinitomicaceae bacterium]
MRIFLKVVEFESITRASEHLYLTQPAVSIQLKKLQEQFEIPLTEVIGRKLFITDFGREIALRSQRILDETEGIRYVVDQYKGKLSGKIKISVVSTGKYIIPYFLKPFMDKYPGVEISINVSNRNRVIQGLHDNDSDFSLVSIMPEGINIQNIQLMDNNLFLVGSSQSTSKTKHAKDLEKVTLLYREDGSAARKKMEDYLLQNDVNVSKSMELVSNEAVKQAVNAELGYSIMPLIGLRSSLINKSIKIVPMKGLPIVTHWNLIYSRDKKLNPAQETLVEFIKETKESTVQQYFDWCQPYLDS